MDSDKKRKIKIVILSVLLGLVLITIAIFATIGIVKKIKSNKEESEVVTPTPSDKGNQIFTNSYNADIAKKILTTSNYSGTYVYSQGGVCADFYNLTSDEIKQIMRDKGLTDLEIANGSNQFDQKMIEEKLSSTKGLTLEIKKPNNPETGLNESYGYYVIKQDSKIIQQGKVYGNENLAVIVNDSDENVHTFISLNYKKMQDAINVSETKQTLDGEIYLFENTYDENGKLLYTISYIYEIASL